MDDLTPNFLRRLSTDEYAPQPHSEQDRAAIARTTDILQTAGEHYRIRPDHWSLTSRTAAGLISLNKEHNDTFYVVDPKAVVDADYAKANFRSDRPVIDVQTHFMAPRCEQTVMMSAIRDIYTTFMPSWWTEMDDIVKWDLVSYIKNIFLESEVSLAILTSNPGIDDTRMLFNDEIVAARALIEGFAGSDRLLHHSVVHVDLPEEVAAMSEWLEKFKPVAWKVYTPGRMGNDDKGWVSGWMLDDEKYGFPFLERVRALGMKRICVHKGISAVADNGSPRDVGPAATAFPDIQFLIYHSGYEFPEEGSPPEGPYTLETAGYGVNRLIHSCVTNGIGPGGNVYPEIGSTWFSLIRRPLEAAHVIGKLIKYFGEDNVIYGSDSIWYGSQQPLIDAFRALQIPDWMCEKYGYTKLTKTVKDKILGGNAARVYGIDIERVGKKAASDDLAWGKLLLDELRQNRHPSLYKP